MNCTKMEKGRCMLSNAGLDKEFCTDTLLYANHLINRLSIAINKGKTPLNIWLGFILLIMIAYMFLVVLLITMLGKVSLLPC